MTFPGRQRNDDSRTVGLGSMRCRHIPADRQVCVKPARKGIPNANDVAGSLCFCRFDGSSQVDLAGVRPGPFSQFSLLGGYLTALSEGDRHRHLPPRVGRHPLSRGGPRGSAHVAAPLTRLNLKSAHHIACKLADVPENHSVKILSFASVFDDATKTREARNAVPDFQASGTSHDS
jgi:hypothetical protein